MNDDMKRNAALLLTIALTVFGCKNEKLAVEAESITLSESSVELVPGEEFTITATVKPDNADNKTVSWSSGNEAIATIDQNGLITAVAAGSTSVKASCGKAVAFCQISVSGKPVEKITVAPDKLDMRKGETIQLTAAVTPEDAEYERITWSSSDEGVAIVDASGKVSAVKAGSAEITAKVGEVSGTCSVTVKVIEVESVTLTPSSLQLYEGETSALEVTVEPADAEYTLEWTSSDESVVTVSNGNVTAIKAGHATIYAEAGGKRGECTVTVSQKSSGLSIGCYYYEDGTYSAVLDAGKKAAGVVFWVGNPAAQDQTLASEHPECTHGLAVALEDAAPSYWQDRYSIYNDLVDTWARRNVPQYSSVAVSFSGSGADRLNTISGYNNTKVLDAFDSADENWDWRLGIVEAMHDFVDANPSPENTSGWYIPSPKELSLLCSGEYEGNIYDIWNEKDILTQVNPLIEKAGGSPVASTYYWSSSESSVMEAVFVNMIVGSVDDQSKSYPQRNVRLIFAF